MASDSKATKTDSVSKDSAPKKDAAAKAESTASDAATKSDGGETGKAPANYSRGEGQKPVTAAYKENWNAIFGKKSTKKKR